MALQRIRHASILLNSKKVAECNKSDTELNSGDELAYGDNGVIGVSDGATSTTLNFDTVVPVSGMSITVEQIILNKQNVVIQTLLNGQIWECEMRFKSAKYTSDATKGTLDGSFNLIGGLPTIS